VCAGPAVSKERMSAVMTPDSDEHRRFCPKRHKTSAFKASGIPSAVDVRVMTAWRHSRAHTSLLICHRTHPGLQTELR
jgi:hypothetical protein